MAKSIVDAHRLSVSDVLAALETDAQHGLSVEEARARLARDGPNELAAEPPVPRWRRFAAQFKDVLVILLLIATAVSVAVWLYERESSWPYEALAILAVVVLNAVMGFAQQTRAESAAAALRAMSARGATVIRAGEQARVPAADLVAGDVIRVEAGDTIPADGRVIDATALQTAESALTGESLPVSKDVDPVAADAALGDRSGMVFSGTVATYGHGRAVVTATGMHSEIGRIAGMMRDTRVEPTPLQRELDHVGKVLGGIVVIIAVVMIATILLVADIHGFRAILDILILGVALAVAAVPEGLPAVVTGVLSLGMQRMARRHAIVRHLAAVETLGSAGVIASDKTGTLTKNEMTVRVVATASGRVSFTGSGYSPAGELQPEGGGPMSAPLRAELERTLGAAARASNAVVSEDGGQWTVQGDPTEGALLVAARKAGLRAEELDRRLPRVGEVPFSSERKLMSTVHRETDRDRRMVVFTKGAPGALLARCTRELVGAEPRPLPPERRREIEKLVDSMADEALRTLAVAIRRLPEDSSRPDDDLVDSSLEKDLVFAGVVGIIDPPRDEARAAVARARDAGIRAIMITGDHPRTASVIARELGLTDDARVVTGADMDHISDDALAERVGTANVYARVTSAHKLRLVKALQQGGTIVAMTGDGVNDAPALKAADIGVAMGVTGTDVAKEAADIILADDNFASIVAAVEEGRAIFANIRKFLRYLLSSNIGEVLTMFFGVLFAGPIGLPAKPGTIVLPLLATQVLWINLVTDGLPALALGVDPADQDLMREPPRPRNERVITGRMWRSIVLIGAVMAGSTLFVLDTSLPGGFVDGSGDLPYAQTMAFTTLVLAQLINAFNARSDEHSAFASPFRNRWLLGALGGSLLLQVLVVYLPPLQKAFGTIGLSGSDWLRCAAAASMVLWVSEAVKLASRASAIKKAPAHR